MGIVLAFVLGYASGARAGADGWDELVSSARQIWHSTEFRAFVVLLRRHAAGALHELGDLVAEPASPTDEDGVLQRVRRLVGGGRGATPSA